MEFLDVHDNGDIMRIDSSIAIDNGENDEASNKSIAVVPEDNGENDEASNKSIAVVPEDNLIVLGGGVNARTFEYNVLYTEAVKSELLDKIVKSKEEGRQLYNDYAFKHGFSIRYGRVNYARDKVTPITCEIVCNKEGFKSKDDGKGNSYNKLDIRTGCKAKLKFKIFDDNTYLVIQHVMDHNHEMIPLDLRHCLKSQRRVSDQVKKSVTSIGLKGVGVATAFRVLSDEAGGDQNLQYLKQDLYNAVARNKANQINGSDAKTLLSILSHRQVTDSSFYYDVEVDEENHLKSFFYRDGVMLRDYEIFGDVVVFDTTFNTNKFGLLLAPFIGINHHAKNIFFGVGFIPREDNASLSWLFDTFKKSMNGHCPNVIMSDQSASIASSIRTEFPNARHRLCLWHIIENSKKHLATFRQIEGFSKAFRYCLSYTDTEAEFNFYWSRLMETFKCGDNKWLQTLYGLRHHWCPALNKDVFSGGILSSQKCESTNNAIKKRVGKTTGLVDVYNVLKEITNEWRSNDKIRDFKTLDGNMNLALVGVPILEDAKTIYTNEIYCEFELEFIKSNSCVQEVDRSEGHIMVYLVWRLNWDVIKHQVIFNKVEKTVECTCKMIHDVGLLCCHALRVLNINCVNSIPRQYIHKRWTLKAMNYDFKNTSDHLEVESPTVWRDQTCRNLTDLIISCHESTTARRIIDKTYSELVKMLDGLKVDVEKIDKKNGKKDKSLQSLLDVGEVDGGVEPSETVHFDDHEEVCEDLSLIVNQSVCSSLSESIKNPKGMLPKYTKKGRMKSITEVMYKKGKQSWKKKKEGAKTSLRSIAQKAIGLNCADASDISIMHPMGSNEGLNVSTNDDYFGVSITNCHEI